MKIENAKEGSRKANAKRNTACATSSAQNP